MIFGESRFFSFKSKAEREKEEKEYSTWAFPHGQMQRDNLEKLMRELYPKEQMPFMMMGFLTCKELYGKYLEDTKSSELAVDILINEEKKYKNVIRKNEMARCVAFVLADAELDESCEYPSPEEMRKRIEDIENLKRKRK